MFLGDANAGIRTWCHPRIYVSGPQFKSQPGKYFVLTKIIYMIWFRAMQVQFSKQNLYFLPYTCQLDMTVSKRENDFFLQITH